MCPYPACLPWPLPATCPNKYYFQTHIALHLPENMTLAP